MNKKKAVTKAEENTETKTDGEVLKKTEKAQAIKKEKGKPAKPEAALLLTYSEMKKEKNFVHDFCEKEAPQIMKDIEKSNILEVGKDFIRQRRLPPELFEDVLTFLQFSKDDIFDYTNKYNDYHFKITENKRNEAIKNSFVTKRNFKKAA